MSRVPKVSVVTITYNQGRYIRETLDSFVAQQTNFDFEVVIADDCSTDGTQAIIREYAKAHSAIFKPILRRKSIGAAKNSIEALSAAKGEYIAWCEGGDSWTDPKKLQRQADFLDTHADYALCFHPVRVFSRRGKQESSIYPAVTKRSDFTIEMLLKDNFIQTSSVMYRRQKYATLPTNVMPFDWYLHVYHAQFGKIGFLPEGMAVRWQDELRWGSRGADDEMWRKQSVGYAALFDNFLQLYSDDAKRRAIIESSVVDMFNRLISIDERRHTDLVRTALLTSPTAATTFLVRQAAAIRDANEKISEKERIIRRLMTDLSRTMEEVLTIKKSKSFTFGHGVLHPWTVPRKAAAASYHAARRLSQAAESSRNLATVKRDYTAAERILANYNNTAHKKAAVILHLYYDDMWEFFQTQLAKLDPGTFDLFVSVPIGRKESIQIIRKTYPEACIIQTPNRGRDVLPFMKIAAAIRHKGYEYFLKLHSKKSKHFEGGNDWLLAAVDNLLPSDKRTLRRIQTVLDAEGAAVVGAEVQYVPLAVNYEANKKRLRLLVSALTSEKTAEAVDGHRFDYGFFAGTMFWARFDALAALFEQYSAEHWFDMERGQIDDTFAHALERMYCLLPELHDQAIYGVMGKQVKKLAYTTNNIPGWSDVYIDPKES